MKKILIITYICTLLFGFSLGVQWKASKCQSSSGETVVNVQAQK